MSVGVELHVVAPPDPGRDCIAELGEPGCGRIAHPLADAVAERLEDRRIGGLARVAHPEVDHLEPLRSARGRRLVEPNEGVGRLGAERGGERHAVTLDEDALAERDAAQRAVGPLERRDLDELVTPMGIARRAGAEVDRRDASRREVRDVRPRLLRLDREVADRLERTGQGCVDRDAPGGEFPVTSTSASLGTSERRSSSASTGVRSGG